MILTTESATRMLWNYLKLSLITFLRISLFKNIFNEPELPEYLFLNPPVSILISKIPNEEKPHEYLYHVIYLTHTNVL